MLLLSVICGCGFYFFNSMCLFEVVICRPPLCTFQPQPQHFSLKKNSLYFFLKKTCSKNLSYILWKKNVFLIIREMELFGPKIKNFLIFFQKNCFLIFLEIVLSSREIKKFQEGTIWARKIKRYPLWRNFLYFGKWNFLAPSLKKSYTSGGNLLSPKNK